MPGLGPHYGLDLCAARLRGYVYLFRATFNRDQVAPLPSPLACDVGQLTITDTENKLSISGGKCRFSALSTAGNGRQGYHGQSLNRVAGRALFLAVTLDTVNVVYPLVAASADSANFGSFANVAHGFYVNGSGGNLWVIDGTAGLQLGTPVWINGATRLLGIVPRSVGAFYLRGTPGIPQMTLEWVSNGNNSATMRPAFSGYSATGALDDASIVDLGACDKRFASDPCAAYSTLNNPTAGATTNAPGGDTVIDFTVTYNGTSFALRYRKQDTDNRWGLFYDPTTGGGTVYFTSTVAGVASNRGSAVMPLVSGTVYRITMLLSGNVHTLHVNGTQKLAYTDTNNLLLAANTVEVVNLSGGISTLTTRPWPLPLSLATSYLLCPKTNDTATMTPDAVLEWTFNYPGGNSTRVIYRVVDANNMWKCWVDTTGGLTVYENANGVTTTRISNGAGTVTPGTHRIVLVVEGNKHTVYLDNVQKGTYIDSNNLFLGATVLKVEADNGPLQELIAWPRTITLPAGV